MAAFRVYLVILFVSLGAYTLVVGLNHGWNLIPVFFADISAMAWPGQFNFDFLTFLTLSAFWLAWRHRFTPGGIALGVLGFFGGMMVLAPYLIWASLEAKGDVKVLLLGSERAAALV